jgi:cell division initiation protein
MDKAPSSSQSILETLRTVEFRLGLKGYNVDEVDEYLEKAAVEAESLQGQLRQVTERLRQASERIGELEGGRRESAPAATAEVADESLQRTLILAQKFVDQTRRESEAEAAQVVGRAEEQAQATVQEAQDRARKLASESEDRIRQEVARLESLRGKLAGDVESMARHLEAERNRLHGALSEMLKWVEEHVQPAKSLMGLRAPDSADPAAPPTATRPADTAPRPSAARPVENGAEQPDDSEATQLLDFRSGAQTDRG